MTSTAGRALIIANGEPPGKSLLRLLMALEPGIYCADGGANVAARQGLHPAAVFGDWDSVKHRTREMLAESEWIDARDQEFTDLDKALAAVIAEGARDISVVGATGRRVDHTLANIGLLLKHRRGAALTLHTHWEDLFLLCGSWAAVMAKGRRVSLLPVFGRTRIATQGLLYPLDDEYLELGVCDGISNQAVGGAVSVMAQENPVLVCVGRPRGADPLFAPPLTA